MGRSHSLFLGSVVGGLVSFTVAGGRRREGLARWLSYGAHVRTAATAFRGTPCAAEAREQGVAGGESPPQASV
jgi:hypothetical protein